MSSRTCALVAPSGECLLGYKPRAADCSRLAPRVVASCLAKPSCYTWPARRYSLCCPAWQLVCACMHCSCKAASVFTINLLYFALRYVKYLCLCACRSATRPMMVKRWRAWLRTCPSSPATWLTTTGRWWPVCRSSWTPWVVWQPGRIQWWNILTTRSSITSMAMVAYSICTMMTRTSRLRFGFIHHIELMNCNCVIGLHLTIVRICGRGWVLKIWAYIMHSILHLAVLCWHTNNLPVMQRRFKPLKIQRFNQPLKVLLNLQTFVIFLHWFIAESSVRSVTDRNDGHDIAKSVLLTVKLN